MRKLSPAQFTVLLAMGGVFGLIAFGVVGVLVLVSHRRLDFKPQTDTHDLRARTQKMAGDYLAKRPHAALVIGLMQRGRTYWLGFGQLSATNAQAPDAKTLFEIGSITKVFTGLLLAQMVQEGALRLDDSIARHLPSELVLPAELRSITLAQLATHASGLPRLPDNLDLSSTNAANPYASYTTRHLHQYLQTAQLRHVPGEKSEYSNLGAGLLGHILELKAGIPYEQLLRTRILGPLDMAETVITLTASPRDRLTPGHDARGNAVPNWDFAVLAPAGALRSCVGDLFKFIRANFSTNAPGLGPALALAQEVHFQSETGKLGLCWQILEVPSRSQFHWHNGGTGGYASFLGFDRKEQMGIVLLSNFGDAIVGDHSLDRMGMELLELAAGVSWE